MYVNLEGRLKDMSTSLKHTESFDRSLRESEANDRKERLGRKEPLMSYLEWHTTRDEWRWKGPKYNSRSSIWAVFCSQYMKMLSHFCFRLNIKLLLNATLSQLSSNNNTVHDRYLIECWELWFWSHFELDFSSFQFQFQFHFLPGISR